MKRSEDSRLAPGSLNTRYNVRPDDIDDPGEDDEFVWYGGDENNEELSIDELDDAAECLSGELQRYFEATGHPRRNLLDEPIYDDDLVRWANSYYAEPFDRTLETPSLDPTWYTDDLIKHLQKTFFSQFPLFRIRVTVESYQGDSESARARDLMIYPDAVWFRQTSASPESLNQMLSQWSYEQGRNANNKEVKAAQYLHMKKVMLSMLDDSMACEIKCISAYDNYQGNYKLTPIWILHPPSFFDYVLEGDAWRHGMQRWVTNEGDWYLNKKGKGCCVSEWILPAEWRQPIVVRNTETKENARINWDDVTVFDNEDIGLSE